MTAVGVVGAGVMGAGIAQLAATHGCTVTLSDVSPAVVDKAIAGIGQGLQRLQDKGKLRPAERERILGRLRCATGPADFQACDVIIEAVAEKLDVKTQVLQKLKTHLKTDAVLASNTSSLSITQIGRAIGESPRVVGMHFFNPVPLMPLVEVISGEDTDANAADRVAGLARAWGKTIVRAKDTPGFIVNRVARGYYLEALRILGNELAPVDAIDRTMRELGGFRMGPFELMDLVGIDVNYSVSESVWQQLDRPARLKPHPIQADLFQKGQLGKKSWRGFYSYDAEPPTPAVTVHDLPVEFLRGVREAVARFVERAALKPGTELQNYIFGRILVTIINEAALALDDGVATRADIDTAMRLGTNYPRGPLEWADTIGMDRCRDLLLALNREVDDGRWEPAPLFCL
jgi:3-hydroxybutyryl-CoA dehydrogenase